MKNIECEIEHIAELSCLYLTKREIAKFSAEMADIIEYMDKLNELDTENITQTQHVAGITNVFREDRTHKSFPREKILSNAPSRSDNCFKVPKIIE